MRPLATALHDRVKKAKPPRPVTLCRLLGLPRSTMSYYMGAKRPVTPGDARRILRVYPELWDQLMESWLAHPEQKGKGGARHKRKVDE